MNRRSFFKVLTGYVAGAFGVSAKAKPDTKTLFCKGKDYPEDFPIPAIWDVKAAAYGASSGGKDDTKLIQEAIDLADDGGLKYIVYIPKGTYNTKSVINIKGCQLNGEVDI